MSFIRRLEEAAAKKLRGIFLAADKRADYAIADVAKLEKDLANAKTKALEESKSAHEAAIRAAEKAQKVAAELMAEVSHCEFRVRQQEENLNK